MDAVNQLIDGIVREIVNPFILLLAGIAALVFLWGVFEMIAHAGDAEGRAKGRQSIIWGLVGLVIIFGAFGIINITLGTFGISSPF